LSRIKFTDNISGATKVFVHFKLDEPFSCASPIVIEIANLFGQKKKGNGNTKNKIKKIKKTSIATD